MRFRDLDFRLWGFLLAQSGAAGWLTWRVAREHLITDWPLLLSLMILTVVVSGLKVDLGGHCSSATLVLTIAFFALLAQGPAAAAMVNVISALAAMALNRKKTGHRCSLAGVPFHRALYNIGNLLLCAAAAGLVYEASGGVFGRLDLGRLVGPIFLATLSYYLINSLGPALSQCICSNKGSVVSLWCRNFLPLAPGYFASASLAAGLAWLYQHLNLGPALVLLFPPCYIIYYAYSLRNQKIRAEVQHMADLNRLNQSIIASLAMAIDAKDRHTHKHIHRVQEYALSLADRLGVSPEEREAVAIASLLHDIGKIGIPERILCKPGKLTEEEFEIIKSHVEIGAMILEPVNFPWPVVPIVMAHHERWDGLGYPKGLKGEEIPIGARIVSLVDVFDALTSDRPYRRAVSREKAIEMLRAGAGTQFDPQAVQAFIEILPEVEARIRRIEAEAQMQGAGTKNRLADRLAALEPATEEPEVQAVLGDLARLAGDPPRLRSLLRGLTDCIHRLVPYSSCAIYLRRADDEEVRVAYASGLYLHLFQELRIRVGEGLAGYVVQAGQPVVNAAAALDLARRLRPHDNLELSSSLCVPLQVGTRVIGAIALYSVSYNFYRAHHARQLSLVANQAAPLVELARNYEETRQVVTEDPLTRLPNAQSLVHFLRHQLAEACRREQPFAVLLVDVDRFCELNRRLGSQAGDRVLQQIAEALQRPVREMDFLARYAGDEFVIVLPECDEQQARDVARRVAEAVQRLPAPLPDLPLRVTAGVAIYPANGREFNDLLTAAERDLLAMRALRPASPVELPA